MALAYRGVVYGRVVPRNGNATNLPSEPDSTYHLGQDYGPHPSPNHIDFVDYPRIVHNEQATIRILGEATGPSLPSFAGEHVTSYPEHTFPPPPPPPSPPGPFRPESFVSTTSTEDDCSDSWINHNQRVVQNRIPIPRWYIENPEVLHERDPWYLCSTCRHINLKHIFLREEPRRSVDPDEYICLGPLKDILRKHQCGLCRLVGGIALHECELQQSKSKGSTASEEHHTVQNLDIGSTYYLTPCVYTHEEQGSGYQIFLRRDIFDAVNDINFGDELAEAPHLSPSYPLGIRLIVDRAGGGRRVPRNHIDFAWVKRCLQLCELNSILPRPAFTYSIRVIDTTDMRIVSLDCEARYVTLSYPWGGAKQVKLTRDMEKCYRESGSLLVHRLPQTIQDAITLVSTIGERYLWVDSLCILQDNEDMQQQLEQMGKIYSGSLFTIHAVSGEDANFGLPGVCPAERSAKQIIECVGGLMVANLLPWMDETELNGAWSRRAWTFQERALSQRHLMIGDGVIFNCWHTYSPEDEHCGHALAKEPTGNNTASGNVIFYAGISNSCKAYLSYEQRTKFDLYAQLTSEYTQRHLTFQSDAARAFQGILSWLESAHQSQFIHGLPETELDAALLWSPTGSCTRRWDANRAAFLFPSWSWLGWIGHAAYPWSIEREYFLSTVHSPLIWQNANSSQPTPAWFTSEDLCLPRSEARERVLAHLRKGKGDDPREDHLSLRLACNAVRENPKSSSSQHLAIRWPAGRKPMMKYAVDGSHRLCFRTLSKSFNVTGRVYQRNGNYNIQQRFFGSLCLTTNKPWQAT
jgi:hypothetical protein